jgi:hypothetical protein
VSSQSLSSSAEVGLTPLFVGRSSSFLVDRPVRMRRPVSALEAAVTALEPIVEET